MSDQPLLKTAGELLGEAREAQGLSLEVLSERTKIPVKVLSAIEMDEYHKISGPLYIKSFLRTCATDLGLDADHVLDLYTRFGGEKGGTPHGDMVWEEEEVQVSRVGLPWPRILMGGGLLVILFGVILFAIRGCGGDEDSDQAASGLVQDVPMSEEATPAEVRRGSLLATDSDSLHPEEEQPVQVADGNQDQGSGGQDETVERKAPAKPVEDKSDSRPVNTEPEVAGVADQEVKQEEMKHDPVSESTTAPVAVSRQEEPPPRDTRPGSLPPAVAGNAGTPFAGGQTFPVVMRLVSDLPVQAEVRRDGETAYQNVAWSDPVALPKKDFRPGRAYGVREGLVVYWGATDHFSLRLDRVFGVEVSINGVPRDISSLRPGEEIILDDHSAASDIRR